MMYTTEDGRVWEKVCESYATPNAQSRPILYAAYDILCETLIHVYEGHAHDSAMPENRVIYRDICSGDMFAIPIEDFETNFTPQVQPEPKTPEELRAERFRRA